jgi:hypothetical protein
VIGLAGEKEADVDFYLLVLCGSVLLFDGVIGAAKEEKKKNKKKKKSVDELDEGAASQEVRPEHIPALSSCIQITSYRFDFL